MPCIFKGWHLSNGKHSWCFITSSFWKGREVQRLWYIAWCVCVGRGHKGMRASVDLCVLMMCVKQSLGSRLRKKCWEKKCKGGGVSKLFCTRTTSSILHIFVGPPKSRFYKWNFNEYLALVINMIEEKWDKYKDGKCQTLAKILWWENANSNKTQVATG